MKFSLGSKLHFTPGSWLEAIQEVVIGMISGFLRSFHIMTTWVYINVVRPLAEKVGMELPGGKRERVPGNKMKVAAVGFGRTGTYSVTLALEELGFPTLHTIHMYAYENEEILHMWTEKIVDPALKKNEPVIGQADIKLIAESGYEAVADLPSCLFYEQILEEYPDCKFLLTTRESSEVWFRSWNSLTHSITSSMHLGSMLFPTLKHYSNYLRWIYSVVNKDASYLTSPFPKPEQIKENAIASYEEHNARVREIIPPEQLLEYSVKDGWEPLCDFLEIDDCPTTPFPKSNSARSMRAEASSAFWVSTIFLLFVLNKLRKSLLKKKTAVKGKTD